MYKTSVVSIVVPSLVGTVYWLGFHTGLCFRTFFGLLFRLKVYMCTASALNLGDGSFDMCICPDSRAEPLSCTLRLKSRLFRQRNSEMQLMLYMRS